MLACSFDRRRLLMAGSLALLAGCQVVPPSGPQTAPPVADQPSEHVLPTDTRRHRVALLVPMTGPNAAAGQSIANATTMALLDTNAENLRITTYDTATGAGSAAASAIADGNRLILGPLLPEDVAAVAAAARPARVPLITYAADTAVASRDVFLMGTVTAQSVARSVAHVRSLGAVRFGALVPVGDYGQQASDAIMAEVRAAGGAVVAMESFERSNASVVTAARRLRDKGGYDAVIIADSARMAAIAVPVLKPRGGVSPRIIGTELWNGDSLLTTSSALRGALFSAVSDARYRQFTDSYRTRFGTAPYRIATLGYDSVLLTLRIAREWRPGQPFPTARLGDTGGFLGLDGPFRFTAGGIIERALEVREARAGAVGVASPAPARFED